MKFFANSDPSDDLCRQIAALVPTNPFQTWPYVQAMRSLGFLPWLLGIENEGKMVCGCTAFMKRGRLNKSLEITSAPDSQDIELFCNGLISFCRKNRISRLEINTFASSAALPSLPSVSRRSNRWEYVLDLNSGDLYDKLHENHKRRIKRARKMQIQVGSKTNEAACDEHLRLMLESMKRRRERGENVPSSFDVDQFKALIHTGAAELFQATLGGRVVSSIMVCTSERGGYYQSGGSTEEGMGAGASHLLHHEVSRILQSRSMETYNLGGAADNTSGLAQFKSRFGAREIRLESAELFLGGKLRRKISTAVGILREDPKKLLRLLFGELDRWHVYSTLTGEISMPTAAAGIVFRKLSDDELVSAPPSDELREEQQRRLKSMGFNEAYGIFQGARLAHVSWLVTWEHESPRVLKLREDEAEITACVTYPEFRGHGIYAFAIQNICQIARTSGIRRVFMKTSPSNIASQKGIERAGLRFQGRLLHFRLPYLSKSRGLIFRGYRRH